MIWRSITAFRLVTPDPDRLARFYAALGFELGAVTPIAADELALLGVGGRGVRHSLTLRTQRLDLDWFESQGRPYPLETAVADTPFQHFALVTGNAAAHWRCALAAGATAIGDGAPVRLPASSGGVTAVKFRDPDGHPLELLQFPNAGAAPGLSRIDHSAIAVLDVTASTGFYVSHGLIEGARTLNRGDTQTRLDGAAGAEVDVVPLRPLVESPHLELLGYRSPRGRSGAPLAANDVAATRLLWAANGDALIRDPDGHLHQLSC